MFKKCLKRTLIIPVLLTLVSCSSIPTDIYINPELNLEVGKYTFSNEKSWEVNSQDLRIAHHLVEIENGEKAAQLINEQQSLRLLLQRNLSQAWLSNSLKVDKESDYKINIQLIKALATVDESALSYEVNSQIIIKIKLTHQGKKFVKLFRSNAEWDAPFSTSVSRITRELNTQLSQLLNQVVQDQELNDKLQQF